MSEFTCVFSTIEEKTEYFINLAKKYKLQFENVSNDLSEFESSSRELESELEMQVTQLEKKNKELNSNLFKLQLDHENLKEKYENLQQSSYKEGIELEKKIKRSEEFVNKLQIYVRDLEQTNDDLERSKRATMVSLEDFDQRLNQAIERNAFLENELDLKENLIFDIQRLKDETRDLHQELAVRERKQLLNVSMESSVITPTISSTTNITTNGISRNSLDHGLKRTSFSSGVDNSMSKYFNHQSKKLALDLTSDMLRSVNSLESKFNLLAPQFSIRDFIAKENPTINLTSSTS